MTARITTNHAPGSEVLIDGRLAGRTSGRLRRTLEQAEHTHVILLEHGSAFGTRTYAKRDHARHAYRQIIDVLVETGAVARRDLRGHVFRHDHGWRWELEYVGLHPSLAAFHEQTE